MAKVKPVYSASSKTLDAATYWKLRAHSIEHAKFVQDAQQEVTRSEQRLHATLTACGLDPAVNYTLDDVALTATPQMSQLSP